MTDVLPVQRSLQEEVMSTRLTDVLITLSNDPFLAEEFKKNPSCVVGSTEISDDEKQLLIDGNPEKIDTYLAAAKKKKKTKAQPQNKVVKSPAQPQNRKTLTDLPEF
jgi:hypothetical protein